MNPRSLLRSTSLLAALALLPTLASAATEEGTEKKFTVSGPGKLVVDVDFGSVEVTGGASGGEVTVTAWRKVAGASEEKEKEFLASQPIVITQSGNTVTVTAKRAKREGGWSWSGNWHTEAKFTVRVPAAFEGDLRTSGGKVEAADLQGALKAHTSGGSLRFARLAGPLDGDTSGGSVTLAQCAGELRVNTSGGSITCEGGSGSLRGRTSGGSVRVLGFGGPADVQTSGGSLTLENVRGSLSGETSGGSVHATLLAPVPGDVRLSTSAGSINLSAPGNAAFELDAVSSVGRVTTDFSLPGAAERESRHRETLRGPVNGGGPKVVLRNSAGSINVRQSAPSTAAR